MTETQESTPIVADAASALQTLVTTFEAEPLLNGKKMRGLVELDREAFRTAAVSILHTLSDRRGCRYVVLLLWTHDLMISLLSDLSIPLGVALSVTSTAARIDPQLCIRLTRYLIGSMLDSQDLTDETACRLIELLASVADAASLQSFLRQILLHPSARIRSKASLLIGPGPAGARVVEKLLADDSERVRANATEALWAGDKEYALPIFTRLLEDKNHRVAGNAILGLYRLGEVRSIRAVLTLNDHREPIFRSVGVWAMGQTKDPRFLPQLGRMLADASGPTRRSVFQAVNSIKKAGIGRASNPPLRVIVLKMFRNPAGTVSAQVVVEGQTECPPAPILPTGFHITAGGESLSVLHCAERRHDLTTVSLVLPRRGRGNQLSYESLDDAIRKCLGTKLKEEPWSITRYTPADEFAAVRTELQADTPAVRPTHASVPVAADYTVDSNTLQSILADSTVPDCKQGWLGAVSRALRQEPSGRASRHLITFIDSTAEVDSAGIEHLAELAATKRSSIHVLCCEPDKRIAKLCSATGGNYLCADSAHPVGPQLQLLYAAMRRLFSVTFERPRNKHGAPAEIAIEVHNATQIGQATGGAVRVE